MINRCQKLRVCYRAYLAWYLQSPFLLAELCPGDCEGGGGREPDRAVSRLFCGVCSSPLPPFSFRVQTSGPEDAAAINEI